MIIPHFQAKLAFSFQSKSEQLLHRFENEMEQQEITNRSIGMKLNNKFLSFEAKFANFCPRERVDFREVLKHNDSCMRHSQL